MRPKTRSRVTAVSEVVVHILAEQEGRPGRKREAATLRVFRAFSRLDPSITAHAEPVQFRAGVLSITVDDSSWLTELSFLRPEILSRMNQLLGHEMVRTVRLRHAPLNRPPKPIPIRQGPPVLNDAQRATLEDWAREIPNPEIKEAMRRAAAHALAGLTSAASGGTPPGPSTRKPGSG